MSGADWITVAIGVVAFLGLLAFLIWIMPEDGLVIYSKHTTETHITRPPSFGDDDLDGDR